MPVKLSIVVPMYNVELYIERCIRSLEEQDVKKNECEILVVDDGSPDSSSIIVKRLQLEFENILLLHKENGGLSSARNYGLKFAKGEYIWFVDSDDYIERNKLGVLLAKLDDEKLDLLAFDIFDVWEDVEKSGFYGVQQPMTIISGINYVRNYSAGTSAWFFIVRRQILEMNNIYFMEGIIHEDQPFVLHLYKHVQRMTFLSHRVYNYCHRKGSITSTRNEEQSLKSIHSWQSIILFGQEQFSNSDDYSVAVQPWLGNQKYYGLCVLFFHTLPLGDKIREYHYFKKIGAFKIGKTHLKNKDLLISYVLRCSRLYFILMCFFRRK